MATYVLVHGGGHGGWCYQRVARRLQADGHEVLHADADRPGRAVPPARRSVDLDRHIEDIAAVLHYEDLRDVILVGHSYGGMVITGAADRAADRVGKLVYLDAATPRNGQSLVDVAGPVINAVRPFGEMVDGMELVLLPAPDAGLLYGVTDPDDLAWMAERLTPHPWKCFEQPLELRTRRRSGPSRSTTSCAPRPWPPRRGTLSRWPRPAAGGRLWDIDTGHDLMITEPEMDGRRVGPGGRRLTGTGTSGACMP